MRTREEKLAYAVGLLKNNVFYDYEVNYYAGKENSKPHGIEDDIWAEAFLEAESIMVKASLPKVTPDAWRLNTKTLERTDILDGNPVICGE